MPGATVIRMGRLAGIPIGIHPLWLLVVALITWSLGSEYYPSEVDGLSTGAAYALGLASALTLFAGILLHELGHAVTARRAGIEVEEIDLWLLGGVARISGEPRRPRDELRFALAGPLVTLGLVVVFAVARLALGSGGPDWVRALLDYQLFVNGLILGFNLMPAFPLDGGRVLRAVLWGRLGSRSEATTRAAGVGRGFGWVLGSFGVLTFLAGAPGGLWFALMGGFIVLAARAEEQGEAIEAAFVGRTVADLMSSPAVVVRADASLHDAAEVFARHLYTSFPVVAPDGSARGLLTIGAVRRVPAHDRDRITVAEAAVLDPGLLATVDTPLWDAVRRPAFQQLGRLVGVDGDGRVVGVLSSTDVHRALRAHELVDGDPTSTSPAPRSRDGARSGVTLPPGRVAPR